MFRLILFYLIVLSFLYSCEKDVKTIIIGNEEQVFDSIPPGMFDLVIDEVTDTEIKIHWTESVDQSGKVTYEILLSDSVVAYDYTSLRNYTFENLMPATNYSISVMAMDTVRNSQKITKNVITKKSFISKIISFDPGYFVFFFDKVLTTDDNGLLIYGRYVENIYQTYKKFILKLNSSYEIEWLKEYEWNDELRNIKKLSFDNFLIIREKSVSKINGNGDEIWVYNTPDQNFLFRFNSAIENRSGDIILVGASWRNWGDQNVSVEYYISQISQAGSMEWEEYGGTTLKNIPVDIVQKTDGNYFVFGTSESGGHTFDDLNNIVESYWILELDQSGSFIQQFSYPNQFIDDDQPIEIMSLTNDKYLLLGNATGAMGIYFHYNTLPRFTLVNSSGKIIWDKTYSLCFKNTFEKYSGIYPENNNSLLFLTTDDYGSAFASINLDGELTYKLPLSFFSESIFLKRDINNNFIILTHDGYLLEINYDGYLK
jgi:hypothetical protein